jgi:hypothetical protein
MAHFAKLDQDNNVLEVIVVNNSDIDNLPFPESELVGVAFCQNLFGNDTIWKQTSYNGNFRRQYAAIGGIYYAPANVFVSSQPYPSWSFNAVEADWIAPVPKPIVPANYIALWNERYLEWDVILLGATT